jgi:hypothetical protein
MTKLKSILILLLLTFMSEAANAQRTYEQILQRMWGTDDSIFNVTEVPEKWKNESAVILAKSKTMEYIKPALTTQIHNDVYERKRIILLDKAAVDEFSEFKYRQMGTTQFSRDGFVMQIKVIKPDGSEKLINTGSAVSMDQETGGRSGRRLRGYKKLVIADLEVGDIIDYYIADLKTNVLNQLMFSTWYEFDPVFMTISEKYPILNGRISFRIERNCYLNLSVNNGLPEPVMTQRDNSQYYEVGYSDIEKASDEFWVFPLIQEPSIKFQFFYASSGYLPATYNLLGKPEIPKTKFTIADYRILLTNITTTPDKQPQIYRLSRRFKRNQRRSQDPGELVKDLYYLYRNHLYFNYFNYYGERYPNAYTHDKFDFVRNFSNILKYNKIDHSVFVGVPRQLGTIDDAILIAEIRAGIMIRVDDEPFYIFNPSEHSIFGERNYNLDNTRIFSKDITASGSPRDIKADSIGSDSHKNNLQHTTLQARFDPKNVGQLNFEQKTTVIGHLKEFYQLTLFVDLETYDNEFNAYSKMKITSSNEQIEISNNRREFSKNKTEAEKNRRERFIEWLKDDYFSNELELVKLSVDNHGRFYNQQELEFSCSFTSAELANLAGDFIILEVGKLIGRNLDVPQKGRDRKKNIHQLFPRSFKWEINIGLPEGYTVHDIEALNRNVENLTGGFISSAKIENEQIMLDVYKYYSSNFVPVENWKDLLEVLDEAIDFSQQKLVLTKL